MANAQASSVPVGGAALVCRGITKNFGQGETQVRALRGIDLEVSRGEVVMLMGPSGCGKTTLLSILGTLLDADNGTYSLLGVDIAAMNPEEKVAFRAKHLGFVFQSFNLIAALTAVENVSVPLIVNGTTKTDAHSHAGRALQEIGLRERAGVLPRQLSGGQQQRVAIARSLIHSPDLLLCDEPTSALDHETGQLVMETLRTAVKEAKAAAVVVTHDERITHFADRIVKMEDGHLIGQIPQGGRP